MDGLEPKTGGGFRDCLLLWDGCAIVTEAHYDREEWTPGPTSRSLFIFDEIAGETFALWTFSNFFDRTDLGGMNDLVYWQGQLWADAHNKVIRFNRDGAVLEKHPELSVPFVVDGSLYAILNLPASASAGYDTPPITLYKREGTEFRPSCRISKADGPPVPVSHGILEMQDPIEKGGQDFAYYSFLPPEKPQNDNLLSLHELGGHKESGNASERNVYLSFGSVSRPILQYNPSEEARLEEHADLILAYQLRDPALQFFKHVRKHYTPDFVYHNQLEPLLRDSKQSIGAAPACTLQHGSVAP